MTSQINYSIINTTYPVAGQDNDSQGFRDNFTHISDGLRQAASEISALQQNAVIVADLETSSTNVVNNLLGSSIQNGTYAQFNPIVYGLGSLTSSGSSIDLNHGPVQTASLTANGTLTFTNWGDAGTYSTIRLILTGAGASSVILSNSTTANFHAATGFAGSVANGGASASYPITTGKIEVIECWSIDSGVNIYIKNSGEF